MNSPTQPSRLVYAVTGATGQLGRLVIEQLKARLPAPQIRALVRQPAKAADLGVEAREADYNRPATLRPALAGVDVLLLISSSEIGQRTAQHRAVIEAARAAGVQRVVYTSLLKADTSTLSLAAEHRETEALLKASGLAYTVLRNGWYTENHTAALGAAVAAGTLVSSAGDGRLSSATRADYAEAAALALLSQALDGQTLELAGDRAWSMADLAAEASRHSGRTVVYQALSPADYASALMSWGLPEGLAQALASWDAEIPKGVLLDHGGALSRLLGRPTTPLAVAVAAALG